MIDWQIITGEYPPQPGGVSDYTRLVARGLAEAGDAVVVWAPPAGPHAGSDPDDAGVTIRRLPDRFGPRALRELSRGLTRAPRSGRILVQYVPHAFGWRAANLPFCAWLRALGLRRKTRGAVWVMFHEVAFPFEDGAPIARNLLAAANRLMARLVGGAADRAFVSIPAWKVGVESVTPSHTPITWLPVPSGIPVVNDLAASAAIRARYGRGHVLVGHFGTYGHRVRTLLGECLPALAARCDCAIVLLGRESRAMAEELLHKHPLLTGRIHGLGAMAPDDVSRFMSACDVMLQPYPDGISSRRTSAMAALCHARPVVTTSGPLTEPVWQERGAAVLIPVDDAAGLVEATAALAANPARRSQISARAGALYRDQFDLAHTIALLRSSS